MELSLIVPTYNERDTLLPLLNSLFAVLNRYQFEIIIVDDASPDGTGKVAEEFSRNNRNIKVLHRVGKRGLASAVMDGFSYAQNRVLGVMDADLQHPPKNILFMLEEIEKGADIVIASRHTKGGSIQNWSATRKTVSMVATFLARMILPKVKNVKDPLSGFFLLKKSVLQGVHLNPTGYKILLEILAACSYLKIVEIPYTFQGREKGESKLSYREYFEFLRHLFRLATKTRKSKRFTHSKEAYLDDSIHQSSAPCRKQRRKERGKATRGYSSRL